jgi:MFS family permease
VTIYSVEGVAGLFGRVVFGLLGDRFGAKRAFVSGLLLQAAAAGGYLFAREQSQFYAVAIPFGFAYAGVMPLYAVLVRENFPLSIIGTVVGATSMASSMGMAIGPFIGGMIFDRFGTYGWLYIGSFVVGLSAAAIMASFRPALPPRGPVLSAGTA